jgi:hypothetical protein
MNCMPWVYMVNSYTKLRLLYVDVLEWFVCCSRVEISGADLTYVCSLEF